MGENGVNVDIVPAIENMDFIYGNFLGHPHLGPAPKLRERLFRRKGNNPLDRCMAYW